MDAPFHLVLIHGVVPPQGDRNPKPYISRCFPKAHIDEFRVFASSRVADCRLQRRVTALLEQLLHSRFRYEKDNNISEPLPLVFMGHDLGGTLIKLALLVATEEARYRSISLYTSAALFFGTPRRNIEMNVWERQLFSLLSTPSIPPMLSFNILQTLPQQLEDISIHFQTISSKFDIINFDVSDQESQALLPPGHLVFGRVDFEFCCGHDDLWRFSDGDSKTEIACKRIRAATQNAGQVPLRSVMSRLYLLDPQTHRLKPASSMPQSVNWIRDHQAFIEWRNQPQIGTLHVSGPRGSGTTAASSRILRMLLDEPNWQDSIFLTFSFNKNNIRARTRLSLYISLCRQILSAWPHLYQHIASVWKFWADKETFTAETFWPILQSLLSHVLVQNSPVFCFLDAIDECISSIQEVIRRIGSFIRQGNGRFKLVLSGSDPQLWKHDVDRCRDIFPGERKTTIEAAQQYMDAQIARLAGENNVWAELKDEDLVRLYTMPKDSTYLLAELRMLPLMRLPSRSTKRYLVEKLEHEPATIDEAYDQAVKAIKEEDRKWVLTAMKWIVYAVRPLKTYELAVAVAVEEFATDGRTGSLVDLISSDIMDDLQRAVGPLIKIIDNRVYPIHETLRSFLIDNVLTHDPQQDVDFTILKKCIIYLESVVQQACKSMNAQRDMMDFIPADREFGLLSYACANWPEHFRRTTAKDMARSHVARFLENEANVKAWAGLYHQLKSTLPTTALVLDSHVKIASNFGLIGLIDGSIRLVKLQDNSKDQLCEAMDLAARNGHDDIVQKLIDAGIRSSKAAGLAAAAGSVGVLERLFAAKLSLDQLDPMGLAPLHHAAGGGNEAVILYLLEHGVKADQLTSNSETALHLASRTGQTSIVEMMIKQRVDVRAESNAGYDALKYAAIGGFQEIVTRLLIHGAVREREAKDGNTALHLAAEHGHYKTVTALLNDSSHVHTENKLGLSPIDIAASEGHLAVLLRLLDHKDPVDEAGDAAANFPAVNPDADESEGLFVLETDHRKSPLEWATIRGNIHVVHGLLERKACHLDKDRSAALLVAAKEGHVRIVDELLKHSSRTIAVDSNANTALHVAAQNGHTDVVRELLRRIADSKLIDRQNKNGATPLHLAAEAGNQEIVDLLLQNKAQATLTDESSKTALHLAVAKGHLVIVKKLLTIRELVWMRDDQEWTAFDVATSKGHTILVEEFLYILNHEAKTEDTTDKVFPLSVATRNLHEDVLRFLLSKNWDRASHEEDADRALHEAVRSRFLVGLRLLLESPSCDKNAKNKIGNTPLYEAVDRGYLDVVRILLESKVDIDTPNAGGRTPLFQAAWNGGEDMAEVLLNSNPAPDLTVMADYGWTPIHAAFDNSRITKLILDAKVDRNIRSREGTTPIALASRYGETETVRVLLEANADPNLPNEETLTPLHVAAGESNNIDIVKLLIENGANKHATDRDRSTALHIAAFRGNVNIVKHLLEQKVDVHAKSTKYGTVLAACVSNKEFDSSLADLVLNQGVEIDEPASPYHTALHAACAVGHFEAVHWLLEHDANANAVGGVFGTALCAAVDCAEADEEHYKYSSVERKVQSLVKRGADINLTGNDLPTALQEVALKGANKVVSLLLENGADVNISSGNKSRPLTAAISGGCNEETIAAILNKDADPTAADSTGKRPVDAAIEADRVDVLRLLVAAGVDTSAKDAEDRSVLAYALVGDSEAVFDYIINNCSIDLGEQDAAGRTPLMTAVLWGETNAVHALLARGFKTTLNAQDSEGKSALAYAVSLDLRGIVDELLENGADPCVVDCRGRGPLYWAAREARVETLERILASFPVGNVVNDKYRHECEVAIHGAIASNKRQSLEKLLDYEQLDLDEALSDGWTPMYTAGRYDLPLIEEILYFQGAENRSNITRQIPMAWHPRDRYPCLMLEPDNRSITVSRAPRYVSDGWKEMRGGVRADFPMWPMIDEAVYYFEVEIVKAPEDDIVAIGFCDDRSPMDRMLGWDKGSWGYHADDGRKFEDGKRSWSGDSYWHKYTTGAVVGCGVNFAKNTAFYTMNGNVIGCAFENVKGKLYPAVSMGVQSEGGQIRAIFPDSSRKGLKFQGPYDGPATLEPPK